MQKTLMIDSQILNTYQSCTCKTYYQFVRNIRGLFKETALDKGGLLHEIMKYHYEFIKYNQSHIYDGSVGEQFQGKEITYQQIIQTSIKKAQDYVLNSDLDVKTCEEVINTYQEYAQYYVNDNWEIVSVENPFAKVIYEDEDLKIVYCGIVDLVTTKAIVDHKSSSRRGNPTGLSNQFMGYAWAFNLNNVVINKIGFQKTLSAQEKFERHTKSYPQDLIDEWKANAIRVAKDLFLDLQNQEQMVAKKNFTSCDKYSGCLYEKICGTQNEAREFIIGKDYMIGEPWNPAEKLQKKEKDNV